MSLAAIVRHYTVHGRRRQEAEFSWFRRQPSLEDAIITAAKAQDEEGNRYSHQRRINPNALRESGKCLIELHDDLEQSRSFDDLWSLLCQNLEPIKGIGDLYIYDTSLRIGAHLGLLPDRVYLHAGTRVGARRLGLLPRRSSRKWLNPNDLPPLLRQLPPHQVEDILCIYKDRLGSLKGCA